MTSRWKKRIRSRASFRKKLEDMWDRLRRQESDGESRIRIQSNNSLTPHAITMKYIQKQFIEIFLDRPLQLGKVQSDAIHCKQELRCLDQYKKIYTWIASKNNNVMLGDSSVRSWRKEEKVRALHENKSSKTSDTADVYKSDNCFLLHDLHAIHMRNVSWKISLMTLRYEKRWK